MGLNHHLKFNILIMILECYLWALKSRPIRVKTCFSVRIVEILEQM